MPKVKEQSRFDTREGLQAVAKKLRAVIDGFELHGDGEHPAVLSDLARISTALTTCYAEIRQAQKAEVREVHAIPLETILSYLRTLPESKRHDIAAELTNADAKESLL